jgi:serine/threonine protein kinase
MTLTSSSLAPRVSCATLNTRRTPRRVSRPSPVHDTVISGYRLIAKLGRGGMGEVHLGVHEESNELVAIKTIRPEHAHLTSALTRFFSEASAASRIDHPGIVRVSGHGRCEDGRAFIIMEYLEGESLRERLQREGPLSVAAAVDIARQVAAALAAAHAKGIIHRDITPANIFLTTDDAGQDQVKILDFGVAKIMDAPLDGCAATPIGSLLGTPAYMSPEQCEGAHQVDHRTDLYALGCVLFAMLCGRPPFTDTRMGAVLGAHLSKTPPRPSQLRATIPAWLDELVLRLLAKERAQRPAGAIELLVALVAHPVDACDRREVRPRDAGMACVSHPAAAGTAARCSVMSGFTATGLTWSTVYTR